MALPQVKQGALEVRLSMMQPIDTGWSASARAAALNTLKAMGLPDRRDEYWKYTNPAALVAPEAARAEVLGLPEAALCGDLERLKIVFVDGVFDPEASDDLTGSGVQIDRLAACQDLDLHWAKPVYGPLEAQGQAPVERPLAALNTAFASDGVLIHVTAAVKPILNIVYRHEDPLSDVMLHHLIKLESHASLTLVENGPIAARSNLVMEVEVADQAQFHHIRAQGRDHEQRCCCSIFASLGQKSVFKSFTLTVNGVLTRNDCVLSLKGDDAVAHVAGACVGDGAFHHDDTVFITHDAVNCESRQVFKKVLRNGAVGVFQGKILVKPGAQKTDGYQISQSLLLDEDSQFLAKPELEIYADDVICSHGSTSGAIDEDGLFYLRSRGVPTPLAVDMLTLAFLAEALDEIDNDILSAAMLEQLEAWLARRRS